jgi:hypothetical protein
VKVNRRKWWKGKHRKVKVEVDWKAVARKVIKVKEVVVKR